MTSVTDVLAQPTGASFFRADLHIHSSGASHDVQDAAMTPVGIVSAAARENLAIIAITDHNEIDNVELAIGAAPALGVYVVPGVELSTSQGHLLCYLPTLPALRRFHGQLSIADRGIQTSRCQESILDCLNMLASLGGFGVLAHIDIRSGFEIENPGGSPHKMDVLSHPALLGVELKHATSTISYSDNDPEPQRVQMGRERIRRLNLGTKQNLARVVNSDAHTLETLGRNAANALRVTRYKMDSPSFNGLRVALGDAGSRVRIEDDVPESVPRILGMHVDGGFLTGQVIQFNPNLNCIVGGRGTGKSTAFEAARCLIGIPSESKVVDSDVWPEELHLFWQDKAGDLHALYRAKDGDLQNLDNPDMGPCSFEIDCFGQGDAARISMQAQTDPLALLNYLDKFVDLNEAAVSEENARERLLTLQTDIEKAQQQVQLIPQYERLLATTTQQLKALQKPEVKLLIELQRQLAREREVRGQILGKLQGARSDAARKSAKISIKEIRELAEPSGLSVGGAEYQVIVDGAIAVEAEIGSAEGQIETRLSAFEKIVTIQIASWKIKEAAAQKRVDDKRRELEALKVSFDMSYINKLAKDEASHQQSLKNLGAWKPHLLELRKQRAEALKDRWAARDRIAMLREVFGHQATAILREALTDLQVSLKYSRNAHSPDAVDQIIDVMGWRTNRKCGQTGSLKN
jgi:histidinol phosphatase-like PHP family hydrolase